MNEMQRLKEAIGMVNAIDTVPQGEQESIPENAQVGEIHVVFLAKDCKRVLEVVNAVRDILLDSEKPALTIKMMPVTQRPKPPQG